MYKMLTFIITERIYSFLDTNNILPAKQGCRKGSYGRKDYLLIIKMLLENSRHSNDRNLTIAWVDYRKAFDSVEHSWILKVLQLYKVSPTIVNFLKISMKE